jgi:hypothetical protein
MAGQTLTLLADALKIDYKGPINDSLYNMTPFVAMLETETSEVKVNGRNLEAVVPIKLGRNTRVGARSVGAALPTAGYVKIKDFTIPLAYLYGPIRFDGQSIKASEKSALAFANVIDLEVNGMVEAMKLDVNRQMCNGTTTGMLCQTNGAGGGATSTVTVDNPGTAFLEEGMPIYSLNAETSGTAAADEDISEGLTESTCYTVFNIINETQFTLGNADCTAAVDTEKWHDNHFIFRYGNADKEMMGLRGIVDNEAVKASSSWWGFGTAVTTFQGLSRATYPRLDAVISHASGVNRALSEEIIGSHFDSIEKKAGQTANKSSYVIFSDHKIRQKFFALLYGDRRYTPNTLDLKGGWKTLAYQYGNSEIPWLVDKQIIPNAVFTLDTKTLSIIQSGKYEWMQEDGNMFQRVIDGNGRYDAYEAMLFNYMSLMCKNPIRNGAIRDISEA